MSTRPAGTWTLSSSISLARKNLVGDRVHKIFVPGRHFDIIDLGFDAAGDVTAIVLVLLVAALARYATRPIGAHARRVWIPKILPASLDTLYGNRLQCQLSIRAIDASALTQTCVFTKRRFLWQCY